MNFFLKTIIIIEIVLVLIFVFIITGIFDEETERNITPVNESDLVKITKADLYQDLSIEDKTTELEDDNTNDTDMDTFFIKDNFVDTLDSPSVTEFLYQDPELELLAVPSKKFNKSTIKKYLDINRSTKLYVLVELNNGASYENINILKQMKIHKIYQLNLYDYLNKSEVFFYIPYYKIKRLSNHDFVKNIHILSKYSALGYYQLSIRSDVSIDKIKFDLFYPHSKPGHEIIEFDNKFSFIPLQGQFDLIDKKFQDVLENLVSFEVGLVKNQAIYFLSKIKSKISLNNMLQNNIKIAAKSVTLSEYRKRILLDNPVLYEKYTRFTDKVVSSEYIRNIVNQFSSYNGSKNNTSLDKKTIASIWRQLTFILDRDIKYDWNKRKLFFSGKLPYNNIKDMYLTAKELGEIGVGACTERTSMEIAVLRELGIATRSSTRLYHIFTEVFLPEKGWVSTSSTLNEIPLCYSVDERMAYFVNWSPDHPINLKWSGYLLPEIITKNSLRKIAFKKKVQNFNN